jgi:hypothetical protein
MFVLAYDDAPGEDSRMHLAPTTSPTVRVWSAFTARKLAIALALSASGCSLEPQEIPIEPVFVVADPLAYADPRIGSGGFGYAHGSAFPGAAAPFGLAKVGPDTRGTEFDTINFLHYSGYWAEDDYIQGFSHLHLHGTGATDYGILGVMPLDVFDASKTTQKGYESHFEKIHRGCVAGVLRSHSRPRANSYRADRNAAWSAPPLYVSRWNEGRQRRF